MAKCFFANATVTGADVMRCFGFAGTVIGDNAIAAGPAVPFPIVPIVNIELNENMEFCESFVNLSSWRSTRFTCWPPPRRRPLNPDNLRTSRFGINSAFCIAP